jgi:hypothetical protein
MKLHIEWAKPVLLKDASRENMVYGVDLKRVPSSAGVYLFGRRWGGQFEALYVGKAGDMRVRVKTHLNNLRLMQHLRNAKTGKRLVLAGRLVLKQGQQRAKCMALAERALIRHFLAEGHDLVNKQGTRLRRHELLSTGKHPKRYFPREMFLEKAKGE